MHHDYIYTKLEKKQYYAYILYKHIHLELKAWHAYNRNQQNSSFGKCGDPQSEKDTCNVPAIMVIIYYLK